MIFATQIAGEPCLVRVTHYRPYVPAKLSGAMEDAVEELPLEFEYEVLDLNHKPWPDQSMVPDEVEERLIAEYEAAVTADKHGKDF